MHKALKGMMGSLYFMLEALRNVFGFLNRGPSLESYGRIDVIVVYRQLIVPVNLKS